MKTLILYSFFTLISSVLAAEPLSQGYTAHEWGTFTSVSRSDGRLLDGLYLEEEKLPSFVYDFSSLNLPRMKSSVIEKRPLAGVNIKMETPVIYFYSEKEQRVKVDIGFEGGLINQWYPQSKNPKRTQELKLNGQLVKDIKNWDFKNNYRDKLSWDVNILAPDTALSYTSPQNLETATWVNPRFTDANLLQVGKERERFIFYRGIARFEQDLKVSAQSDRQITLSNQGNQAIPYAMVYEFTQDKKARIWWQGSVGSEQTLKISKDSLDVNQVIHKDFQNALVEAGLYKKEAVSMLETWRHSYFEKPGLRVFWIVPRDFTDKILPIKLQPAPENLERVLVGRTEVLTPEFEQKMAHDFISNENPYPFWYQGTPDRFFIAWQNRVRELIGQSKSKALKKFEFLREISTDKIPYGQFYIHQDKKTQAKSLRMLRSNQTILSYSENAGQIEGQVTYFFSSKKASQAIMLNGFPSLDRKAVFRVIDNQIQGDVKIYDSKGKLIERRALRAS